jgi:hypothetical protein
VSAKGTKRRSPGEGGAYSYKTREGLRWYWKAVIAKAGGAREPTVRRGFATKADALDAMREALGESKRGTFVDPSRQMLGVHLDEWLAGLRLEASTIASYRIIHPLPRQAIHRRRAAGLADHGPDRRAVPPA